jgi:hypothetical protein
VLTIAMTRHASSLLKTIVHRSLQAFIEIDSKLFVVSDGGLLGEPLIAVVNHRLDVYLLEPTRPAPRILLVHDPAAPTEVTVTDFPSVTRLNRLVRRGLAATAVGGIGEIANDIHLP